MSNTHDSTARSPGQDTRRKRRRETPAPQQEQVTLQATPINKPAQWQGCCKLAFNLHHQPTEWQQFQAKLQNGYSVPQVGDQRLMTAAITLVEGMAEAGVKRWDWLPAPSEDDLAQASSWVAQRLADRRREQDEADAERRWQQKQARAFGQRAAGTGTINPVHLQKSKYSLGELADRLERTKGQHESEGREFKHELLDHHSPDYINVRRGGISSKQITIMACEITGVRERRTYDESWSIVMDWLSERNRAKEQE